LAFRLVLTVLSTKRAKELYKGIGVDCTWTRGTDTWPPRGPIGHLHLAPKNYNHYFLSVVFQSSTCFVFISIMSRATSPARSHVFPGCWKWFVILYLSQPNWMTKRPFHGFLQTRNFYLLDKNPGFKKVFFFRKKNTRAWMRFGEKWIRSNLYSSKMSRAVQNHSFMAEVAGYLATLNCRGPR